MRTRTLVQLGTLAVLAAVAVAGIIVAERTADGADAVALASGESICISGTRGLTDVSTEAESVRQAYASARHMSVEVVVGCPPTRLFDHDAPLSAADRERIVENSAQVVRQLDDRSRYMAFVYVAPSNVYEEYFGDAPYVRGVAQFLCSGHSCGADGVSIYLPSGFDKRTVEMAIGGEW